MKLRRPKAIIAVVLVICLSCIVALFGFIVDFSSDGGIHGGGVLSNCISFAPYIYNNSTMDISMTYTAPAKTVVLFCTYTIMDSAQRQIDGSIMLHLPFSSEYVISKTLTNLVNGNYTFTITVHYADGTIQLPLNDTFTVDTNFIAPKLTIISPQNQTYNTNDVELIYNTNYAVKMSYYNLDGNIDVNGDWKYLNGNVTLNGLSVGMHKLILFVRTDADIYTMGLPEQTVYFKVNSGL